MKNEPWYVVANCPSFDPDKDEYVTESERVEVGAELARALCDGAFSVLSYAGNKVGAPSGDSYDDSFFTALRDYAETLRETLPMLAHVLECPGRHAH